MTRGGVHSVERTSYRLVGLGVESLDQTDSVQRRWPDSHTGVDEESTGETGETVTDKVGTERVQELVTAAEGPFLAKEYGECLRGDDVVGIGRTEGHAAHDSDEHVFLLVERSGVETVFLAE